MNKQFYRSVRQVRQSYSAQLRAAKIERDRVTERKYLLIKISMILAAVIACRAATAAVVGV